MKDTYDKRSNVGRLIKTQIHACNRGEALVQWLKLPAWKVRDRGPYSGLQVSKRQKVSSPLTSKDSILWGASVTKSVLDLRPKCSNFESCDWRAVSSHLPHHPQ